MIISLHENSSTNEEKVQRRKSRLLNNTEEVPLGSDGTSLGPGLTVKSDLPLIIFISTKHPHLPPL